MTLEELQAIKEYGAGWIAEDELTRLIEAYEEAQVVSERAMDIADDYRERYDRLQGLLRRMTNVGSAVLISDERGQGIGYTEAMRALARLVDEAQREIEGRSEHDN